MSIATSVPKFQTVNKTCNICNKKFKVDQISPENATLHIQSKRHKKALKKLQDDVNNNIKAREINTRYSTGTHKKSYKIQNKHRLDPIARTLLIAVYDKKNIWSKLREIRHIVQKIWQLSHTDWTPFINTNGTYCHNKFIDPYIYSPEVKIKFPEPQNINVNMMPFIMSKHFCDSKLPDSVSFKTYFDSLIKPCIDNDRSQRNKIGFLTIDESRVPAGRSQRRPGIHVESPGVININTNISVFKKFILYWLKCHKINLKIPTEIIDIIVMFYNDKTLYKDYTKGVGESYQVFVSGVGNEYESFDDEFIEELTISWGEGDFEDRVSGGIYMASSVDNSCAVWNCQIDTKVIGHLGDIEHLRSSLPSEKREVMKKNCLYWITDRTPHEALAMDIMRYRQFFRLVTSNVSVWYEQHSTKNPNGVCPDINITKIIKSNKFSKVDYV